MYSDSDIKPVQDLCIHEYIHFMYRHYSLHETYICLVCICEREREGGCGEIRRKGDREVGRDRQADRQTDRQKGKEEWRREREKAGSEDRETDQRDRHQRGRGKMEKRKTGGWRMPNRG